MRKATTKRKATKRKFSGVLDRPMIWKVLPPSSVPMLGGPISDEERRAVERDNLHQLTKRFAALFKHYEVDPAAPDADSALLLRLAQDSVRGFEIRSTAKRGRGATKKWDAFRSGQLVADVARIRKRGGYAKISARNACQILTKKPRFAARYGQEDPDSLYARYKESFGIVRADGLLGRMVAQAEAPGYLPDDWSLDDWFVHVFSDRDE
jgi:hypothetical protein